MLQCIYLCLSLVLLMPACKNNASMQSEEIAPAKDTVYNDSFPLEAMTDTTESDNTELETERPKSVPKPEKQAVKDKVEQIETNPRPKSVPKPEKKPESGEIESVNTQSPTGKEKPKSVPKPEPQATIGSAEQVNTETAATIDHSAFDQLLSRYVSRSGQVNYKGLKSQEKQLDRYLEILSATKVEELTKDERLAFWINTYNAFTIKRILQHYPVSSIMDIDNGKTWDVSWIDIDGRSLSLNEIENDIIRPQFKEPRIHFAVNCAAVSCPPLLNKAWTASNLETYLDKQTRSFINNMKYNLIEEDQAQVSRIFEWYGKDFGNLRNYLNKYSETRLNDNAEIIFKDYNWELND